MSRRVNITFNKDNPMDAMIIDLLGGESGLSSKGIKSLLLHVAVSGNSDSFIPLKRNVIDTKDEQKEIHKRNVLVTDKVQDSNNKDTQKLQQSVKEVTEITQDSNEDDTFDFDITIDDTPEAGDVKEDYMESLFNSMMNL